MGKLTGPSEGSKARAPASQSGRKQLLYTSEPEVVQYAGMTGNGRPVGSRQLPLDITPHKDHNVVLMIGEFEYLILAAAATLGEGAYGAAIRNEIEKATAKRCSIGALYTTLDRLEQKAFVKTRMGAPTPERGGRAKRMVWVTANGMRAASDFYAAVMNVSKGVSWQVDRIVQP